MYRQANVRAGKVLRPPIRALPSVIVVTEKVMREADGPVGRAALTAHSGWKGDRSGVRLESHSGEQVRSPKITSVIKICTDAGFLKTVEVGQCFMTKDTDEFLQFTEPVLCREYTLPRDEKSTDPEGWIRRNTKIGPVLEVTTSFLQGEYGVEIRIESVHKDNSHSWVTISHGLNKLVTDLIDKEYDDNEQETSETKTEVFALKTEAFAFASRSKANAKP